MSKFKVGDKVKLVGNKQRSTNTVGDIGIVTQVAERAWDLYCDISYQVQVEGNCTSANWSYESDLELLPSVTYEEHWRLNDGSEEIPENADTLEKDGSVVAYRKVKEPDVVIKESRMFVGFAGYLTPLDSPFNLGKLKITTTVTDDVLTDVQVEILED